MNSPVKQITRILGIDPGLRTTGISIIDTDGKLGYTRGAAICTAVAMDLPVYEYAPKAVKQSVVGKGAAAKSQIQYMVSLLLNIKKEIQEDAADALAVAICHANSRWTLGAINQISSNYRKN